MTDNDTKKALNCCKNNSCKGCPCNSINGGPLDMTCVIEMSKSAFDYISRLEAENERLSDLLKRHQRHTNRIRLLTAETAKKIKAEARKEFAERLKENSNEIVIGGKYKYRVVTIEYIDNLYKDLAGE